MTDRDIYWTFATAQQFGGGFYRSLAGAGIVADPRNKQRILTAFPELTSTYGPASTMHRKLREGVKG